MTEDKPHEGYHYEWVDAGPRWSVGSRGYTKCRIRGCPQEPVEVRMRDAFRGGFRNSYPWAYCADHLHGRIIRDGKILERRYVADEAKP